MGDYHAKFEENWWCGFQIKRGQQTDGHSFIIIGMYIEQKRNEKDLVLKFLNKYTTF